MELPTGLPTFHSFSRSHKGSWAYASNLASLHVFLMLSTEVVYLSRTERFKSSTCLLSYAPHWQAALMIKQYPTGSEYSSLDFSTFNLHRLFPSCRQSFTNTLLSNIRNIALVGVLSL